MDEHRLACTIKGDAILNVQCRHQYWERV
ncbi:hypothetical protein [Rothia sp. LK2492]